MALQHCEYRIEAGSQVSNSSYSPRYWFSSDQHIDHKNIIRYCDRPFESVGEMESAMVGQWNRMVDPRDYAFILGDIALSNKIHVVEDFLAQLNGRVYIVPAVYSHDAGWLRRVGRRDLVGYPLRTLDGEPVDILDPIHARKFELDGKKILITMCHFPLVSWPGSRHESWHLHGHTHGRYRGRGLSLDVGVDSWNFAPVSLETVADHMLTKMAKRKGMEEQTP